MAKRKKLKKPLVRRAIEIDVTIKRGAKTKDVLSQIKKALDEVAATEVFEPGDTIVVRNEVGNGGNGEPEPPDRGK